MNKPMFRRFVVFFGVTLAVAAVDLGTKWWASANLAWLDHPLPMTVPQSSEGRTLAEFLQASEYPDSKVESVVRLEPGLTPTADCLYPVDRVVRDMGYFVFLDEGRDEPPLFVPNPAREEFNNQTFKVAEWRDKARDERLDFGSIISGVYPFLDKEEACGLFAKGLIHPLTRESRDVSASLAVKGGDIFLLTESTVTVIPGFLRLIYAENPGAAWGFLGKAPVLVRKIVLQAFSFFAMLLIAYIVYKMAAPGAILNASALALIMGGALGNFVDRFHKNFVVDFIDMYIGDSHWPTYNVADIGISVGVGLLVIQMIRKQSPF